MVVAVALAFASLGSVPAGAHAFTKTDGNDSPSKIDLRSVSVSHTSTSVVHKVRTWNAWTAASLQHDSFLWFGINKDDDPAYERCAFIYYTTRLRGQLSNCGNNFIRFLTVAKLNATTASVRVPKSELGGAYRWFGGSAWEGAAPCRNTCYDFAPNRLPDIFHDLTPPVVTMTTEPLDVWDDATSPDFVFPFSVNDVHTGVSWSVQSRPIGTTTWTTVASGTGEGAKAPAVTNVPPGQYQYRVVAIDSQGNRRNGPIRLVYVPTDVDADTGPGVSTGGVDTPNIDAYGGSYVALDDADDVYEFTYVHSGSVCRRFALIGPGSGTWAVSVSGPGGVQGINEVLFPDAQRQTLWSATVCGDATWTFDVTGGSGFGVDAVVF